MKVKAPESETVSRSLRRAGLTDKQIRARLNRALLCLDHIGNGERISVEVFECFSGQLKVNGDRLRFNQVLRGAGLIRETRPAIQGLCSAEYKCRGKSIEQEIKLNREEAQIPRKIKATRRKAEKADKTLQWLNKATKHSFEGGCYLSEARALKWQAVSFQRAFAAIVSEAARRRVRERIESLLRAQDSRDKELSSDFQFYAEIARFADSLNGKPCTPEMVSELCGGRAGHLIRKEGFNFIKLRLEKILVEAITDALRANNIPCATDGFSMYATDADALESAFVSAGHSVLGVDLTQRDEPILTPLFIQKLRVAYAKKNLVELEDVPRARAKHWQPDAWQTEGGRELFKRSPFGANETLLGSVSEALEFYGLEPDEEPAEEVTLDEGRRQIFQTGEVRADNAEEIYWKLEELGDALPVEPTRQVWELTEQGKQSAVENRQRDSKPRRDRPASRGLGEKQMGFEASLGAA